MPVCIWSHETSDRTISVALDVPSATGGEGSRRTVWVLPEHEADLRACNASVTRNGRLFLVATLGLSALVAVVASDVMGLPESASTAAGGLGVAAIGLVIAALPFATPQTIQMVGIRRSVVFVRALGLLVAAMGVWVAAAG